MPLQLAELAIHIPSAIPLFEKYEFNYYQNGSQTLKEACKQKGLDFDVIDGELAGLQNIPVNRLTIEDMDLNLLIDRINGQHHDHESEVLSEILTEIHYLINDKTTNIGQLKVLEDIENKFSHLKERLLTHCNKEDKVLFPMIRKIAALQKDKSLELKDTVAWIKALVKTLEHEHLESVSLIAEIKNLLLNFGNTQVLPDKFPALMKHFKEFELDFHIHIHIENNVLFPKIQEMDDHFKR
jgi:regulator of cell morphogenesis and NO signaling